MKKPTKPSRAKKAAAAPAQSHKEYLSMWVSQDKALAKDADKYADILRLAILDSSFRSRLVDETAAVLKEFGVAVPKNLKIAAVDNNGDTLHLLIPRLPAVVKGSCSSSLADWDLKAMEEKKHCIDDFNRGNGGFGDTRDSGDPHTAD